MERNYHFLAPMLLASFGSILVAFSKAPELRLLGLVFCYAGVFSAMVIFWAFASHIISPQSRPVGMAFISTAGMVASVVQYTVMSILRDLTHSWAGGLVYVAVMLFAAAVLVLLIPANEKISVVQAISPHGRS
jgi:ACS family 4-hydroxyphenylacetate permease-like MFS transporter